MMIIRSAIALTEDTSLEDIQYDICVRQRIEQGLADGSTGRVVPHAEVVIIIRMHFDDHHEAIGIRAAAWRGGDDAALAGTSTREARSAEGGLFS